MTSYIRRRFTEEAKQRKGMIGLPTLWDIQLEVQERFGISDHMSQVLTWAVVDHEID
jgi:hypothetical protein